MQIIFAGNRHEAGDVWSFDFVPAAPLMWEAGQSARFEITGPYGPIEKRFTIAAPPSGGVITLTTRLSGSDYKDSLNALQPGDKAQLYGIEGDFAWRESPAPHVFVAGGIGITPFYALLAERAAQNLPLNATLLYSNHDEHIPFKPQLNAWQKNGLTVNYFDRRITVDDVLPRAKDYIYLAGSTQMASTLSAGLRDAGIVPAKLIWDEFTGRLPSDS
jgi:ferredoxin-NADP reductase